MNNKIRFFVEASGSVWINPKGKTINQILIEAHYLAREKFPEHDNIFVKGEENWEDRANVPNNLQE